MFQCHMPATFESRYKRGSGEVQVIGRLVACHGTPKDSQKLILSQKL